MKLKNNLKTKIWIYLILLLCFILFLFWILNIALLGKFYENSKKDELNNAVNKIINNYNNDNLTEILDSISYNSDICIEIYSNNKLFYVSNDFHRGCMIDAGPGEINSYKKRFMSSDIAKENYEFINPRFNNKVIMSSLKIDDKYIFINTSLEPIDSTVKVIKKLFIYLLLIVLILSFFIAYFISSKISKPIVKINENAKKLAKGNYDTSFDINSNINEITSLATTLEYTKNELSKTEDIRREFLANVSHDLKTPLTMIKAYAEMVRDLTYNNEEKRNNNLNTIIEETDRLNLLVNDILDLSKLQNNSIKFNEDVFNIDELIKDIINRYQIYTLKDGYNIEYNGLKKIDVVCDKKRIEQVIYNLLSNALNYTGDDKVVRVKLINKKNTVRVEVIDTGSGISKEELEHIWDKYYKVDKTYARMHLGSGIGLSIVKNILDIYNLPYGVNSSKNGSTFYFEIKKK